MNAHIEALIFAARTVEDNVPIHLHFHDIRHTHTADDVFYVDNGITEPVACQYQSLQLLTPEAVFEASLPVGR